MRRFATGLTLCAMLVFPDSYPRQPDIDVQHYVFRIALNDENNEIAGETTVRVRFLKGQAAGFTLDLAQAMRVLRVTSADAAVKFTHESDRLGIALATPVKAG